MSALDIRVMRPAELQLALDWAAAEGWNPGLADVGPFLAADPEGFLLGCLDGEPVGCISLVRYGDAFAFLGFYIVRPEWRGRGYGLVLWQAAMARAARRNVGLDGVVAQQANYRKSGFALAHRNIRYGGQLIGAPPQEPRLVDVAAVPFAALAAYDRLHFPAPREAFLRAWIDPPRRALALASEGEIRGYGVVRDCHAGAKVGPLFADDPATAELLLRALAATTEERPLLLDVPEPNAAARAIAERHGLRPVLETARMYTDAPPPLPLQRIFGITTFELG
jgi:GNAT superfamily N-acetyltransferase